MGKKRKERSREAAPGRESGSLPGRKSRPSVFSIRSAFPGLPGRRPLGLKRYSQCLKHNPVPAYPSFNVTSLVHLSAAQPHETWQRKTVSRSLWEKEQGGPEATQTDCQSTHRIREKAVSGAQPMRGPQELGAADQGESGAEGWPLLKLLVTTSNAKWAMPLPCSGLSFPGGSSQPSWALASDSCK